VTVAVVDGGVDLDHPDLDPGDRSRVIQGYDFGEDDSDPDDDLTTTNGNWLDHGTPVAGTIGARTNNNQTGVAGLMWDVKIIPLKIADNSGTALSSTVGQAFDYARLTGPTSSTIAEAVLLRVGRVLRLHTTPMRPAWSS
jgi:subtilisin family serine protease